MAEAMERSGRARIAVFHVFLALLLVLLGAATPIAESNFTDSLNKISGDLNRVLSDVLNPNAINYTPYEVNVTYDSSIEFHQRGMAILYNATRIFMKFIFPKDVYYDGLIWVDNDSNDLQIAPWQEQWQNLIQHYIGPLILIVTLVVFALLMPLCGFCFCCCRCCGHCGARSKPFDKKGDLCRKCMLGTLLIVFGTLLLFGVVCTFLSNYHLQNGTDQLTTNARTNIKDVDQFLNASKHQVNVLMKTNYKEFQHSLFTMLDNCSEIMHAKLGEYSKATAVMEVVGIVNGLDDIKANLTFMKRKTNELRTNSSQLNDGLRKVKKELLQVLKKCTSTIPECAQISDHYVNQLKTDIDFDMLPDISSQLDHLNDVIEKNITDTVREGQRVFQNIEKQIKEAIQKHLPRVKSTIRETGKEISNGVNNITTLIDNTRHLINERTKEPLRDADDYIKQYGPYRNYVGLVVGAIFLTIALCIALGLVCGVCGKRPDAYSDDCCNKGSGSCFLILAVALMFLTASVLTAIGLIYFVVGTTTQRIVCDSLYNINDSKVIDLLEQVIDKRGAFDLNNVSMKSMINACRRNESFFKALQLEEKFNFKDADFYMQEFNIHKRLEEVIENIDANTHVVILSEDAENQLRELVASGIANIHYDKYAEELKENLTSVDLVFLARELLRIAAKYQAKYPDDYDIPGTLNINSVVLEAYQQTLIVPMTEASHEIMKVAANLKESLKFGKSSFEQAIDDLIDELKHAQNYLQNQGLTTLKLIAHDFGNGIESQVRRYLDRVIINTKENVARCGPLYTIYNSTLVSTCSKILLPMNGFWFSIFWNLLLYIPTIILCVKLASLYQKYEPYPGALIEAEYLYDAYADRDSIPLNSGNGKKKYKKGKFGGRGVYAAEPTECGVPRDAPGGSHYNDTRYADMAPKYFSRPSRMDHPVYYTTTTVRKRQRSQLLSFS